MTQVDQSKSEMVSGQENSSLQVKTNQQGAKLVNPGKRALTNKAVFVHLSVEEPFSTTLNVLPIAFIFSHVRHNLMIEAHVARIMSIKSAVSIKECASDDQA